MHENDSIESIAIHSAQRRAIYNRSLHGTDSFYTPKEELDNGQGPESEQLLHTVTITGTVWNNNKYYYYEKLISPTIRKYSRLKRYGEWKRQAHYQISINGIMLRVFSCLTSVNTAVL